MNTATTQKKLIIPVMHTQTHTDVFCPAALNACGAGRLLAGHTILLEWFVVDSERLAPTSLTASPARTMRFDQSGYITARGKHTLTPSLKGDVIG